MVVKLKIGFDGYNATFESRAVLDGSQTLLPFPLHRVTFESRAVLDGSQTGAYSSTHSTRFESRAVLVGVTDPILTPTQINKK